MKIRLHKNVIFVCGIILIALFSLIPLYHPSFYNSHDGQAHLARFAAYFQAFHDGQIIPRWAGNLNYGFGTPVFIFYYPLPGYIASLLHVAGIHFETIFKILIGLAFILAPIAFYYWAKLLFRREIAFIGALLYGFAPYHFLDLYVRGDVAEIMAFIFVPLVFYALEKIIQERRLFFILLGAVAYALLIISHHGIGLMFSPVFFFYSLLRSKSKKIFFLTMAVFILGFMISAFFWIPALYEGKYTNRPLFIANMYKDHFPSANQLIYSAWGFGPDVNKEGGLSPQIGILPFLLAIASVVILLREKKQRYQILGWLLVFFCAVFIALPVSDSIWKHLILLRLFEFPWRFVALASFVASVLACFVLEKVKNKILLVLVSVIFLITIVPFITVKDYSTHPDAYYESHTGTTTFHGEDSTVWSAGYPSAFAKSQAEIVAGRGKVLASHKKTQRHMFTVDARDTVIFLDNTWYFPGWKVKVDNQEVPIQFQDANHRGMITFQIPKGKHEVAVVFGESFIRKLADALSAIGLAVMCCFFLIKKQKVMGLRR